MWTTNQIKGKILHKLTRLGMFNHCHTSFDNMQKGFPKEIGKDVKQAAEELIKENILVKKPTSYGLEVSINIEQKEKILNYIKGFLES